MGHGDGSMSSKHLADNEDNLSYYLYIYLNLNWYCLNGYKIPAIISTYSQYTGNLTAGLSRTCPYLNLRSADHQEGNYVIKKKKKTLLLNIKLNIGSEK